MTEIGNHPLPGGSPLGPFDQRASDKRGRTGQGLSTSSITGVIKRIVAAALTCIVLGVPAITGDAYGSDAAEVNDVQPAMPEVKAPSSLLDPEQVLNLPLTVFIDGPTGFVFVYTAEGWKFVRDIRNERP